MPEPYLQNLRTKPITGDLLTGSWWKESVHLTLKYAWYDEHYVRKKERKHGKQNVYSYEHQCWQIIVCS